MRLIRLCLPLILALILQGFSFGAALAGPRAVREEVLENGLKVLLLETPSPAVTFQVWYRVGARNEVDGKSGLSHFLEHMMFKGTAVVPSEEHMKIIAKNGGRANAFTMQDATVYFATMSREKIGTAIRLEADRMVNARLDGNTFEAEKRVVMEERRLRTEDRPASALAEVTSAVAYTIHPYRRPVIGWMQDLHNLAPQDLKDYYRTYYSPNNAFIVVAGDFSSEEMLAEIDRHFGKIPRSPTPPPVTLRELPQKGERRVVFKKSAELPSLLMLFHVPNLDSPDSYALDLLSVILAGGRSSRLHRELVYSKRLARTVDADYDGNAIDPTTFSIEAQAMPGKTAEDVESAIDHQLDLLKSEPISEKELQKAKNQVEAAIVFRQDSIFGQAMRIGRYEISGGWSRMDRYLTGIRGLAATDIVRVTRKYLNADQRTVGTLIPIQASQP